MSAAHTPMVVAAARVLCNQLADACKIDHEDAWKEYGDDYLDDAKAALDAAGALELLSWLKWSIKYLPDNVKQSGQYGMAQAVITKATGAAT